MEPLENVIDRAAEICGSYAELARRIDCSRQELGNAKAGRRGLAKPQIVKLADLLGMQPAELWTIVEMASLERRNPFKASAPGALSAAVMACVVGVLSLMPFSESRAAATRLNEGSTTNESAHRHA